MKRENNSIKVPSTKPPQEGNNGVRRHIGPAGFPKK